MIKPLPQVTPPLVAATHQGEMESDSSHRELPPEPLALGEADSKSDPPTSTPDAKAGPSGKQPAGNRPGLAPSIAWINLEQPLQKSDEARRPGSILKYRKAKASSEPTKRFGKGSVVDEAS